MSDVVGTYTVSNESTIVITADGSVDIMDRGCADLATGLVALPRAGSSLNLYTITYKLDCPPNVTIQEPGIYKGNLILLKELNQLQLMIAVKNTDRNSYSWSKKYLKKL